MEEKILTRFLTKAGQHLVLKNDTSALASKELKIEVYRITDTRGGLILEWHLYDKETKESSHLTHVVIKVNYHADHPGNVFSLETREVTLKRTFTMVLTWNATDITKTIRKLELETLAPFLGQNLIFSVSETSHMQYWGLTRELCRKGLEY